ADLRGVLLDGAELKEANPEKADLREAELCSAKLEGANSMGRT
ncbi:MAG: pentapeptide repeat-containing protein, partial [Gemmatimonadetes bacterium]|nr:pentapeptide repeat-containing protein [Gemmatimonadota bacterium]